MNIMLEKDLTLKHSPVHWSASWRSPALQMRLLAAGVYCWCCEIQQRQRRRSVNPLKDKPWNWTPGKLFASRLSFWQQLKDMGYNFDEGKAKVYKCCFFPFHKVPGFSANWQNPTWNTKRESRNSTSPASECSPLGKDGDADIISYVPTITRSINVFIQLKWAPITALLPLSSFCRPPATRQWNLSRPRLENARSNRPVGVDR